MEINLTYVDSMFKANTGLVTKGSEGIPADQWLLKPGEGSNHLLWVMGHLVWARGNAVKMLGSPWTLSWAKQFSRGATGLDPSEFPPIEEIRKAWADVSSLLPASLAAATPELLSKPADKPSFDGTLGGFIAFLALHETYHVGQLAYLRKWLGHGQLVG